MNKYMMIWEPKECDVPWSHVFEISSDEMAKQFTQKIMTNNIHIRLGCEGLQLWNVTDVTDHNLVATFKYRRLPSLVEEVQ